MGVLSEKELNTKLEECITLLDSDLCKDALFIVFVVSEYFKYLSALKAGNGVFNFKSISDGFRFGNRLYAFRNALAHIDSIDEIMLCLDSCKELRDDICSYFTGDVYHKVYNALS